MAENMFMTPHPAAAQLELNISDIIDVMPDEKNYGENEISDYVGRGTPSEANCSAVSSSLSRNDPDIEQKKKAYVQIIEQPQPKALRFRYICEGRSAGSIPGVRSTAENKTFPSIKIMNYRGPAVVVVSCVTVDPPYRPHPHNLVGKEGCSKGVCTVTIDNDSMECMFSNLGIQCVKKKDVEQALRLREEIRVDPFSTGFSHRNQPQSIDLNAVRLCFQVFLNTGREGRFTFPLSPKVSDPIYDKKAAAELNICKLSDCTSCVSGGKEIILLCDKVAKEDIKVRFFEEKDGLIEWEALGDFQASDVHKQVAISFKTPKYKDIQIEHSVKVFIQLQRPSDGSTSERRPFEYLPMSSDHLYNVNKRRKIFGDDESSNTDYFDRIFPDTRLRQVITRVGPIEGQSTGPRPMKVASRGTRLSDNVKVEPSDSYSLSPSSEPKGVRTVTVKPPISPQHNGGGIMFQNIPPLPPLHPFTSVYEDPLPPQIRFHQMSTGLPVDHGQSPYPTKNPLGTRIYIPNAATEPNLEMLETENILYHTIPYHKPPVDTNVPLPDLGILNSTELTVDSVNNLSASLSCSLNLGDGLPSLNPLDKKCSEDYKSPLITSNSDNTFANIPYNAGEQMNIDDSIPSSSDSLKLVVRQLETLNKFSERS